LNPRPDAYDVFTALPGHPRAGLHPTEISNLLATWFRWIMADYGGALVRMSLDTHGRNRPALSGFPAESATCAGHDALGWFAAIDPTVAAFAAAWAASTAVTVTTQFHQESQSLQRDIARPLLVMFHKVSENGPTINWDVELRNTGKTAANIEKTRVFAAGREAVLEPLPAPGQF